MEHVKFSSHNEFIYSNLTAAVLSSVLRELRGAVSGKCVLILGFKDAVLDHLDNGKLYYAVPSTYPLTHWPKIRPFKTVMVNVNALPFAPNTFEVVVINHYLEFFNKNAKFLDEIFRILKQDGKLLTVAFGKRNSSEFQREVRSLKTVVSDIVEAAFHISNIWGINKKVKFLSYNFNYRQNKLSDALLGFFQLLSNIVVITADKRVAATESVFTLKEKYEPV
ncbi:MAG: class I SAM-dependent methyltransferase [Holosporaceae bacterium]|jgi:SAM-dependent methyltransferase|nr:class I SAM-dependent methyltransferase [Holosporaceae bacterium]